MRIQCRSEQDIERFSVRHLTVEDWARVRARLGAKSLLLRDRLDEAARQLRPFGKALTIPVIVDGTTPVALPTLAILVPGLHAGDQSFSPGSLVSWQIRYKAVDKEVRDLFNLDSKEKG